MKQVVKCGTRAIVTNRRLFGDFLSYQKLKIDSELKSIVIYSDLYDEQVYC